VRDNRLLVVTWCKVSVMFTAVGTHYVWTCLPAFIWIHLAPNTSST